MAFTTYLGDNLLNMVFRNVAYTRPTTVYAALFTTATDISGGGTEVSGGSYARQAITFSASSSNSITNSADITFPTATGTWGTISYFAIYDASTSGNMLVQGQFQQAKTITSGDIYKIKSGDITLGLG
jgi:hypothetical protein